jgi:FkbM family methyltransferase
MHKFSNLVERCSTRYLSVENIERYGLPFSRIAIFGAGIRGILMKEYFSRYGCDTILFIDNDCNKQGTDFDGLHVLSLQQFISNKFDVGVFIASHAYQQISRQLINSDFFDFYASPMLSFNFMPDILEKHGNEISNVFDILKDEESRMVFASVIKSYKTGDDGYFRISKYSIYSHPLVRPLNAEILIDGGAFNGDTALQFHKFSNKSKIISFEPTKESFAQLLANTEAIRESCLCINKALWSSDCVLNFVDKNNSQEGNCISPGGKLEIEATSIDSVVEMLDIDKIDLIKLDVEGAELESLLGSRKSIERFHPKLQICVYHSIEDIWMLPLFISSNFNDYDFYIGHHSFNPHDTVLYAV